MKREDLAGRRFGKLVAQKYVGKRKWLCKCDCGNETVALNYNLKSGSTTSCGCVLASKKKELTGKRFGRLVAIKFIKSSKTTRAKWLCKCDCGNICKVQTSMLINGTTVSCGCYNSEMTANRNRSHGKTHTPEYGSWNSMIERCNNSKSTYYRYYGDRGIKICERWLDYNNFYEDMHSTYKKGLTIDRIDSNGNYEPSNCRWATMREQVLNRRCTRRFTYKGETHILKEWSEITGIKQSTLYARINSYGWPFEKAITTKIGKKV